MEDSFGNATAEANAVARIGSEDDYLKPYLSLYFEVHASGLINFAAPQNELFSGQDHSKVHACGRVNMRIVAMCWAACKLT